MTTKSSILTITILLGLTCFNALGQSQQQQQVEQLEQLFNNMFKNWMSKHTKQYGVEETPVRYSVWKSNYDFVQQHNSKNLSWELEVNQFADLTSEEFSALHLGLNLNLNSLKKKEIPAQNKTTPSNNSTNSSKNGTNSSGNGTNSSKNGTNSSENGTNSSKNGTNSSENGTNSSKNSTNSSKNGTTPSKHHKANASVDWRLLGAVTYVKNQGNCGACWSFSSSGALEGLHAIKYNKLIAFSEQQLVDCSVHYGTQGCNGGDMVSSFNYTQKHGIVPESDYQYAASQGSCKHNSKENVFKNHGFIQVPPNNHSALKTAVSSQPVSVGIEASSRMLQLFKSGVISSGCSTDLDHGVLIVGYGTASNGKEYWIVKNSWGSSWGLDGYMNIAIGSQNLGAGVCGINMMASYPTL